MAIARWAMLAVLPAALSGCFLAPGNFVSTLDLRRDGSFAYAYKGEIVFESPDELMKLGDSGNDPWSDDKAVCEAMITGDGVGPMDDAASNTLAAAGDSASEPATMDNAANPVIEAAPEAATDRACTAAEIAEQRKTYEDNRKAAGEKRAKEAKQFGALFGFTPGDDVANRKLAATYARYQGFRTVSYRGNGVFDVDYAVSGMLTHDLVFPVLPQQDIVFPFVIVRRQNDGSARVAAPSLIGGGLRGMAAKMKEFGAAAAAGGSDGPGPSKTRGTFTVTTDGEILTNNTEDGATTAPNGRALKWEIGPDTQKAPEALIGLRR